MKLRPEQRYAKREKATLDHLIDLVDGIQLRPGPHRSFGRRLDAQAFSGAVSMALPELHAEDGILYTKDIFDLWPIPETRFLSSEDIGGERCIHAIRSMAPEGLRGKVVALYPKILQHSWAKVRDRKGKTYQSFYAISSEGSFTDITNIGHYRIDSAVPFEFKRCITALAGMALWLQYEWTVEIRAVGSNFSITFPTTPEGARKLLSLRDIQAGHERRKALRHWVNAHKRSMNTHDGVRDVDVREHLRGIEPFLWEDLQGIVRPSAWDLRRAVLASSG